MVQTQLTGSWKWNARARLAVTCCKAVGRRMCLHSRWVSEKLVGRCFELEARFARLRPKRAGERVLVIRAL